MRRGSKTVQNPTSSPFGEAAGPTLSVAALIESSVKAAVGGVMRLVYRPDGSLEFHVPLLVDLETAAAHLGCSVKSIQRLAKHHHVRIYRDAGVRINLRDLVASIQEAA